MKRMLSKVLASLLCMACLPAGLQAAAQEEPFRCQYVVLKVINAEDDTKPIAVTLLQIGDASNHSFLKGWQGVLSDTCIIHESDDDELINNVCQSVEYGDIIEYRGNSLCSQTGTSYNYVSRFEYDNNDSFEKIGTVFDNPTSDVESKVVDGESVIAVHPADGSTYLIGKGAADNLLIELSLCPNAQGDVNNSGDVDIIDVIALNKYVLGVQELSESAIPAADMNGNEEIDSSDSLALLKTILEIQ